MVVTPMGSYTEVTELVAEGTVYNATVPTSAMGFYSLVSTKEQSQSIIPYYVPVTKAQEVSEVTFGERGAVSIKGSKDNEALVAYLNAYAQISRSLFAPNSDLSNPALLKGFITKADSHT